MKVKKFAAKRAAIPLPSLLRNYCMEKMKGKNNSNAYRFRPRGNIPIKSSLLINDHLSEIAMVCVMWPGGHANLALVKNIIAYVRSFCDIHGLQKTCADIRLP